MYKYTPNNEAIIDVTKPPYNADNTGNKDCTEALKRALDDILRPNIKNLEKTHQKLLAMPEPDAEISFEIKKLPDGTINIIFPEDLEPAKILYFPNGTYLVSNTISYTLENLRNIWRSRRYMEMNRQIYFKGESRDGVIIKLKDNCPGFEYGAEKPVVSFLLAEKSNIAHTNCFENITIDVGKENPGAVGLVFFGNNTGRVENVKIVSSDAEKRGFAGLEIRHEIVSGCYIKNIEVDGFNYGVRALPIRNFMVFEDIRVSNQKLAGFFVRDAIISIRSLVSRNIDVSGLVVTGATAHVVLVDSEIHGNNQFIEAIELQAGSAFIRNVTTSGYGRTVTYANHKVWMEPYISEYVSDEVHTAFENEKKSIPIPVEETPEIPWSNDPDDWCCVTDFGAVGDGVTDDTEAIQRAFNSGRKYVFFQPRKYLVDGSITIPESIVRVSFMYCNFVAGDKLINMHDKGLFVVTGNEGTIVLEDVFTWEQFAGYFRFIDHAGKRTLVMSDLHTQTAAQYFNSVEGGKVYIENCGCTLGGEPYLKVPAYAFKGQKVWARHINPERSMTEILNDHSSIWIMGFKTESYGTSFKTINGGHTEVLGGTISIGANKELPAIVNDNSTVSVVASTNGYNFNQIFPVAIEEIQKDETRKLLREEFPVRILKCYKIPLYVGRKK